MGTGFSNLADGMLRVALPLIAAKATADPIAIGGVVACFTAPWIVTSFHVGVLVDRVNRRHLLIIAQAARLAMSGLLLLLINGEALQLELIYLAALVLGVAEVIAMTCETAIVPMAIRSETIPRVNAWITGLENLGSETIGPTLGGLLITLGPHELFGTTVICFFLAVLASMSLKGKFSPDRDNRRDTMLQDGKAGLAFLRSRRDLIWMTVFVGVVAACWSAWRTLIVVFAVEPGPMQLSSENFGLLVSILGAGGLVGAIAAGPLTFRMGRKSAMFLNILGTTAMLTMPLVTLEPLLIGLSIFTAGFGSSLWSVNSRTVVQQTVPNEMVGRFYSTYRMLSWGCLPVGAILAGTAAQYLGVSVAFGCMAILAAAQIYPFWAHFDPLATKRSD